MLQMLSFCSLRFVPPTPFSFHEIASSYNQSSLVMRYVSWGTRHCDWHFPKFIWIFLNACWLQVLNLYSHFAIDDQFERMALSYNPAWSWDFLRNEKLRRIFPSSSGYFWMTADFRCWTCTLTLQSTTSLREWRPASSSSSCSSAGWSSTGSLTRSPRSPR